MRAWLLLLGGMLVWAAHFGGAYAISSVFDVVAEEDAVLARLLVGGLTLLALAANALLLRAAVRAHRRAAGDEAGRWIYSVGGLNAALSIVAVLWQGLPGLVGH